MRIAVGMNCDGIVKAAAVDDERLRAVSNEAIAIMVREGYRVTIVEAQKIRIGKALSEQEWAECLPHP